MNKFFKVSILSLVLFLSASPLYAQIFTREGSAPTNNDSASQKQNAKNQDADTDQEADADLQGLDMTEEEEKEVLKRLKEKLNPRIEDGNLVLNPIDLGKTGDGSPRGTAAFISTDSEDGAEDGNIFFYYSNFQIMRTAATGLGCRVRFHILNGLNSRVSNVSIKLVWPGINTPLSFNNVNPNTENYFDYALFGDGCYQMDKIPNIVVNRCRVKGMSQEACANRIRWLTKR